MTTRTTLRRPVYLLIHHRSIDITFYSHATCISIQSFPLKEKKSTKLCTIATTIPHSFCLQFLCKKQQLNNRKIHPQFDTHYYYSIRKLSLCVRARCMTCYEIHTSFDFVELSVSSISEHTVTKLWHCFRCFGFGSQKPDVRKPVYQEAHPLCSYTRRIKGIPWCLQQYSRWLHEWIGRFIVTRLWKGVTCKLVHDSTKKKDHIDYWIIYFIVYLSLIWRGDK